MNDKALKNKFDFLDELKSEYWYQEGVESELAKTLREEIDKEIVNKLKELQFQDWDWFRVNSKHIENVEEWIAENIKCRWGMVEGAFYFESKDEAVMFSLRWVGNDKGN